jgi:hypothetical protein
VWWKPLTPWAQPPYLVGRPPNRTDKPTDHEVRTLRPLDKPADLADKPFHHEVNPLHHTDQMLVQTDRQFIREVNGLLPRGQCPYPCG